MSEKNAQLDRQIEKKLITPKRLFLGLGTIALILISWFALNASAEKSIKVERAKLTIDEVVFDEFQDMVTVNGSLEPVQTVQITASEGGRVEEVFIEDGAEVHRGQPIMRLSNATMQLDFMNRETQIIEQINNLRSTRISLDQNKRQVQEQLLEVNYQLLEQKRIFSIDSVLFRDGAIARGDYDESKNQLIYLMNRLSLLQERKETDEAYRQSQLHRIDSSIELMERNLGAIHQALDNLTIKAPIGGHISQFDHEIGESKNRGETLGRVDVLDSFLIAAPVDQYYLNRVHLDQKATADLGGREFNTRISKIFPSVENGQFTVHLSFTGKYEVGNLRRGQNTRVRLELSAKEKALILKKGGFYQSSSGNYVYVLNDENSAEKRKIKLGSQNPRYFKVLEGLSEGERVITSSYDSFGDSELIKITN